MKYMIFGMMAMGMCLALAAAIVAALNRRKRWRLWVCMAMTLLIFMGLAVLTGLGYLEVYSHADATALQALQSGSGVEVSRVQNGWRFDGPGERCAMIFYPGAKVEAAAYAPMLHYLAEKGIDTFLVEMPFRIAILNQDAAIELQGQYSYDEWIISGHSLGGTVAASAAADHAGVFDGIVLLASYPTEQLEESLGFLSIYGSEDGCLNLKNYEADRKYWPQKAQELIIKGGNHAQFGNYGLQRGDGQARISWEEQQDQTVQAILSWAGEE